MSTEEHVRPFPVDDVTLNLLSDALDARLSYDETGEQIVVGADFTVPRLLQFLSGYDPTKIDKLSDDVVEYTGPPLYTRDCVIRALVAEVRRLR